MRQKFSLTSEEAHAIVTAAKLEAIRNNWKVSIAVVDEGGYLLHLERMDGATLPSPEIAAIHAGLRRMPRRVSTTNTGSAATNAEKGRLLETGV